jgi:hypothetical protein
MPTATIPLIAGISELQRSAKSVIGRAKVGRRPVFLAERSKVSSVILDIETYENLLQAANDNERNFWLGAQESAFSFWNDAADDDIFKTKKK